MQSHHRFALVPGTARFHLRMRTATVSTNQIEFDLFNLPLVTIPALPAFIPQVVPAGFRWVSQPDFEAVSPRQKLADKPPRKPLALPLDNGYDGNHAKTLTICASELSEPTQL